MYFSKHNKEIVYINHYSGLLEVEGKGIVYREDSEVFPVPTESFARNYDTLSITEGITELKEGFLDAFPYISCFIFNRSVEKATVTAETIKRMRKRKVLIRGEYDTFAERFAKENGLNFLHRDIHLAEDDIEIAHEHDIITLRFHENGLCDIHYNCFAPGSSAGNYGGGEVANPLPDNFYVGCTIEDFANILNDRVREQILSNKTLKRFLEISNKRYRSTNKN